MELVNTRTGEITSVERREASAVAMLSQAISALTTAVESMPITEVVNIKAQVATIATATKELGMSKEAQELAAEAVRRAEWAVRRATKKAQEAGELSDRLTNLRNNPRNDGTSTTSLPTPRDMFASEAEYRDALVMGELEPSEFEEVLAEAKAEGNLSRANVARKAKGIACGTTRRIARPEAEKTLNALDLYLSKAARAASSLTPDQIRRIKPKADLWTVGLRESVETLQRLLTSLEEN